MHTGWDAGVGGYLLLHHLRSSGEKDVNGWFVRVE